MAGGYHIGQLRYTVQDSPAPKAGAGNLYLGQLERAEIDEGRCCQVGEFLMEFRMEIRIRMGWG